MLTRKNQRSRVFSCLAMTLLLISTIFTVQLSPLKEAHAEAADQLHISDFVSYSQHNNEYKSFISSSNLTRLKSGLEKGKMLKIEMYKEVYRELGYSDEEIDRIGAEEIGLIMESSIEITVNQQYLSIDEYGNQEILSKEECLNAANAINAKREEQIQEQILQIQNNQFSSQVNAGTNTVAATADNDDINNDVINIEKKGCMVIRTRSDYIDPSMVNGDLGRYYFSATYEWLTPPNETYTDAFSIYVPDCALSQDFKDIYSKSSYNYVHLFFSQGNSESYFEHVDIEKYDDDRQVQASGVYYTYSVPESYSASDPYLAWFVYHQVSDLNYYIRVKARISKYNQEQDFNVFSRYEHLRKTVNVSTSFDWTIGSWPGVSVTPSVEDKHDVYTSFNYTGYDPAGTNGGVTMHSYSAGIIDGATYYLRNVKHGTYLDVDDEKTASGTTISTYPFHGRFNQKFTFKYLGMDLYEIEPVYTPGIILSFDSNAEGSRLNINTKYRSANQRFRAKALPDNKIILYTQISNFSNAVCFNSAAQNQVVQKNYNNISSADKGYAEWILVRADSGYDSYYKYYIKNAATGLYLDVVNQGTASGSIVHARPFLGVENQIWKKVYCPATGQWMFKPMHQTDMAMDAYSDRLVIYSDIFPTDQSFSLEPVGDAYRIRTSQSNYTNYLNMGQWMGDDPNYRYVNPKGTDLNDLWILEIVY